MNANPIDVWDPRDTVATLWNVGNDGSVELSDGKTYDFLTRGSEESEDTAGEPIELTHFFSTNDYPEEYNKQRKNFSPLIEIVNTAPLPDISKATKFCNRDDGLFPPPTIPTVPSNFADEKIQQVCALFAKGKLEMGEEKQTRLIIGYPAPGSRGKLLFEAAWNSDYDCEGRPKSRPFDEAECVEMYRTSIHGCDTDTADKRGGTVVNKCMLWHTSVEGEGWITRRSHAREIFSAF